MKPVVTGAVYKKSCPPQVDLVLYNKSTSSCWSLSANWVTFFFHLSVSEKRIGAKKSAVVSKTARATLRIILCPLSISKPFLPVWSTDYCQTKWHWQHHRQSIAFWSSTLKVEGDGFFFYFYFYFPSLSHITFSAQTVCLTKIGWIYDVVSTEQQQLSVTCFLLSSIGPDIQ